MRTCVVIPTYNERDNIAAIIGAIYGVMQGDVTVCVVDDSSPDGTGEAVEALKSLFPSLMLITRAQKEGLGRAYLDAFKRLLAEKRFDVIATMDADFSHHPSALPTMLAATKTAAMVIGSRYVRGGKTVGWELWRRALSAGGNVYARLVTGSPMRDLTAGFVAYRTEALAKLDLASIDSSGYAFQIELKLALLASGASWTEVPIVFTNRINGESKLAGHVISEGIIAPWNIRFRKH